ncbi:MAG: 3-oxoacyl-[acyl-carrier-protein] synthase III C-terminal domain-containing protein [Pseudobdellovibrio sp.]
MNESSTQPIFPRIISVGTAVPKNKYTQKQVSDILKIKSEKSKRFFTHEHIATRHLCEFDIENEQNNSNLIQKFKTNAVELSTQAINEALEAAELKINDIGFICCVTSTGFIVPSLSLLVMEKVGFSQSCERADIVGMGCSAGLNGLSVVSNWCSNHPEQAALLLCCEISSAIYVAEEGEKNALVNSLFGDGVAVAAISTKKASANAPKIIKFSSYRISNSLDSLRFDWNRAKNLNQFYVGKETPELLGQHIGKALTGLNFKTEEIKHWILHTGGASILDKIQEVLNLSSEDLRNTRSVLKDYGNISSGSFLFSFKKLQQEKITKPNDNGIMITMGPGLSIEMALVKW